jgi:hypothetical protein
VGRLENLADDVTQPLEIKHQNSGERITLDSSGFETSGDVRPGRNLILEQTTSRTPDSVVHQYRGQNFTSSIWADSAGQADMTMNGVQNGILDGTESVKSGSSDGVDDFGLAKGTTGPKDLPENETFGMALSIKGTDTTNNTRIFNSSNGPDEQFNISDSDAFGGGNGRLLLFLRDGNRESLAVETDDIIFTGDEKLIVINKNSNNAAGIEFYVNDMVNTAPSSIRSTGNFLHTNYSNPINMGFFARNSGGTIDEFKAFNSALFEFSVEPYSQSERSDLKARRPEI